MLLPLVSWAWPESPIAIGLTVLIAIVVRWLLSRAIKIGVKTSLAQVTKRSDSTTARAGRILASMAGVSHERHRARTKTVGSVLQNVTSIVVYSLAVLMILAIIEVPLGPLLASAGVGGVALGFGAQSLVKDFLSGMFMILEDQYGVGDYVDLGDVKGTVEEVGLRVTRLRDATGQVWYVRNGEIVRVGNQSQGWSTGTIDVPVAATADPARVIEVLNRVMDAAENDPRWTDVLLERPSVAGVNEVRAGTMTVRVFAKCAPNQHWGVQRGILEDAVAALRAEGIPGPIIAPTLEI